jgi:hypothetical protein
MAVFKLESEELDAIQEKMTEYGEGAAREINEVLHGEGAREINDKIMQLLPVSGRRWKGKKAAASEAQPFTQEDGMLSVTIKTTNAYNYLYFPDDGTNTKKHIGNKQFMAAGAENTSERITELCIGRLTEEF